MHDPVRVNPFESLGEIRQQHTGVVEGTVEKILYFQVVELRRTEGVEKGLCRVEEADKDSAKLGICRSIHNAVTSIGEAQWTVIVRIFSSVSLRDKDQRLEGRWRLGGDNAVKMTLQASSRYRGTNPPSGVWKAVSPRC